MPLIEITEEKVIVSRASLDALVCEVIAMRKDIKSLKLDSKLDALCKGEMVTGVAVRKIMNWSPYQFTRRLQDENNPIPMTYDGKGYVMPRAEFIKYYDEMVNLKISK